jgi:hypothetical protein
LRKLFWIGLLLLLAFELLRVWLIMPMPGSQSFESLDLAYALHRGRWLLRGLCAALIAAGAARAFDVRRKALPVLGLLLAGTLVGLINTQLLAERIFRQPSRLVLVPRAQSALADDALVLGVEQGGEAHAWPLRFLVQHHQVPDVVGGRPVLATYCSVCRTGRVFEPLVEGRPESFRLVGMDRWNAMLEDSRTGSWWRQATGEAVTGPLKGERLPELPCAQMSLGTWTALHPGTLVMEPDPESSAHYDPEARFERGESLGELTRRDPEPWQEKSWIVGVELGGAAKAWDWGALQQARVINDVVGGRPLVLVLASDGQSFAAFERPSAAEEFVAAEDGFAGAGRTWDLAGRDRADPSQSLTLVPARQEFWHSWRTFHPGTLR